MREMLLAVLLIPLAACGDGERVPVQAANPPPAQNQTSAQTSAQQTTPEFVPAPVANRSARAPSTSNIQFQGYGAKK